LGTGALSGGTAMLITSLLLPGLRNLRVVYGGDSNDLASGSATVYQEVTPIASVAGTAFQTAIGSPFNVGTVPLALAIGDFNGDGKLDLVVPNYSDGTVTVAIGAGSGGSPSGPRSRWEKIRLTSRRAISTGMATWTWPSPIMVRPVP